MNLSFVGTFNTGLLTEEILSAYPELNIGNDVYGLPIYAFDIRPNYDGIPTHLLIEFPDDFESEKIQSIVSAHDPNGMSISEREEKFVADAIGIYKSLPDWAKTWTIQQTVDYIHTSVFSGMTSAQAQSYIDTNVKDLATAKTVMKIMADAIVVQRSLIEETTKLLMAIRDIELLKNR